MKRTDRGTINARLWFLNLCSARIREVNRESSRSMKERNWFAISPKWWRRLICMFLFCCSFNSYSQYFVEKDWEFVLIWRLIVLHSMILSWTVFCYPFPRYHVNGDGTCWVIHSAKSNIRGTLNYVKPTPASWYGDVPDQDRTIAEVAYDKDKWERFTTSRLCQTLLEDMHVLRLEQNAILIS